MEKVQIFISYAREDQDRITRVYDRLVEAGYDPWLDRENLVAGQKWEPIIKQALKRSDFVVVCLSSTSINKRGFLQKEIKQALEHSQEKLEDDVWLIPARLDDCEVPEALSAIQWVDLFEDHGIDDLLRAFEFQLNKTGRKANTQPSKPPGKTVPPVNVAKAKEPHRKASATSSEEYETVRVDETGRVIHRATKRSNLVIEDLGPGGKLELIEIPGGEFWMGSSEAEAQTAFAEAKRWNKDSKEEWFKAETPRHRVKISPFLIGRYPVTQSQWFEVMGDLPQIEEKLRGDDHPIVNVSWEESVEFCKELTRRTGHQYRLTTEAEWEYACRAGTSTPFAFGPTLSPEIANYWWSHPFAGGPNKDPLQRTTPVGSLGVANDFGLFDMHGNVWEWCSDWYGDKYYEECRKQGIVSDPSGPEAGSDRVIRGGGWGYIAVFCRSADRLRWSPDFRDDSLGFRLVRIGR